MVDQQGDPLLNSLVAAYLAKVAPKVGASFQKTVKVRFSQVCPISVLLSLKVKMFMTDCTLYMTLSLFLHLPTRRWRKSRGGGSRRQAEVRILQPFVGKLFLLSKFLNKVTFFNM